MRTEDSCCSLEQQLILEIVFMRAKFVKSTSKFVRSASLKHEFCLKNMKLAGQKAHSKDGRDTSPGVLTSVYRASQSNLNRWS